MDELLAAAMFFATDEAAAEQIRRELTQHAPTGGVLARLGARIPVGRGGNLNLDTLEIKEGTSRHKGMKQYLTGLSQRLLALLIA
jgi:hypothetical protein